MNRTVVVKDDLSVDLEFNPSERMIRATISGTSVTVATMRCGDVTTQSLSNAGYSTYAGWLEVNPQYRRRGIGEACLEFFLDWNDGRTFFMSLSREGAWMIKHYFDTHPDRLYCGPNMKGFNKYRRKRQVLDAEVV